MYRPRSMTLLALARFRTPMRLYFNRLWPGLFLATDGSLYSLTRHSSPPRQLTKLSFELPHCLIVLSFRLPLLAFKLS